MTISDSNSSSDLYTILFREAPIGLGLSDQTGKLVMFNKKLLEMSGFSEADIAKIGYVTNLYYDTNDRDVILGKAMRDGHVDEQPVRFKHKSGDFFHAMMSLRRVIYNGQIHWLALVQDVTLKLESETAIKAKMEELAQLNKVLLGRELKMIELKQQITELTDQLQSYKNREK